MSANDNDLKKFQENINSKENVNEFYVMISHKLAKMSKRTHGGASMGSIY